MVWLFGDNSEDLSQLPCITMCVKETISIAVILGSMNSNVAKMLNCTFLTQLHFNLMHKYHDP